jgi:hypothetical protein
MIGVNVMIGIIAFVDRRREMVDVKKLRELGEFQTVPMSQMLNKPVELVCVLSVYQLEVRPHSSLGYLTPAEFAAKL